MMLSTTGEKIVANRRIKLYAKKKASVSAVTPNHAAMKNGIRNPADLPIVDRVVVVKVSQTIGLFLIYSKALFSRLIKRFSRIECFAN
jgi:hypothetical protein